ncbi:outer membrane protein assembly factor BamA [Solemya velum gill symbiont]|uniref:outer membrane protein assembly factor BamA n=1 Tax=Solemya velum gill symbiont TaxID=2340 RepID=UPI0021189154|nr:outer membrane protein assembly factor BamA [Solemya velum gill symbiont]
MMKQTSRLFVVVIALLITSVGFAASFSIKDIRVEGLQRISAGTVFSYIPYEVGDRVDQNAPAEIIRSLYGTGFFKDVQLEQDGNVLVVSVVERPAIASITLEGNKDIDDETILESMRSVGFVEGRVFNELLLDRTKEGLKSAYFDRGKYSVQIDSVITPLERNRVAVDLLIREGRTATIEEINIVGNTAFDEDDLQDELSQSTGSIISRFTKEDRYSRQKMTADIETLRSYYMDRGYIKFDVDSTQVNISPESEKVYLTMNISEGDVYTLSDVKIAGKTIVEPEKLFPLIHLVRGEPFSRKLVVRSAERLTSALSDQGYAFAKVNPIPVIDEEKKTVAVTFYIEPGRRVYVRRINIQGNTRSRDRVLRREFRQMESAWYSAEQVTRSKERLLRLGYFDKVDITTSPVPGAPDQIDINVSVVEHRSGELMSGVGYSQSGGVSLQASISEENFFGTGKKVKLGSNTSDVTTYYELSYTDPYFTMDGVSQGFTLRYSETDLSNVSGSVTTDYATDDGRIGINFGFPITEHDRFRVTADIDYTKLKIVDPHDGGTDIVDPHDGGTDGDYCTPGDQTGDLNPAEDFICGQDGNDSYLNYVVGFGWTHDSRNRAYFPTNGSQISAGLKVATPGSDLQYFTANYNQKTYVPVWEDFVLAGRVNLAYGAEYGDSSEFPFFKRFYAGGPGSVRGFQAYSMGPTECEYLGIAEDSSCSDAIGGTISMTGSLEFWTPPPLADLKDSMRLVGFVDFGNVFDPDISDFDVGELRYSAGIGMSWLSPVGLLNVSYALPLNETETDEVEEFQFTIGTRF